MSNTGILMEQCVHWVAPCALTWGHCKWWTQVCENQIGHHILPAVLVTDPYLLCLTFKRVREILMVSGAPHPPFLLSLLPASPLWWLPCSFPCTGCQLLPLTLLLFQPSHSSEMPITVFIWKQGESFFFNLFVYLFLERGEGREKERERNISVWLPLTCPLLGTWPATQACAMTGNWTDDT